MICCKKEKNKFTELNEKGKKLNIHFEQLFLETT